MVQTEGTGGLGAVLDGGPPRRRVWRRVAIVAAGIAVAVVGVEAVLVTNPEPGVCLAYERGSVGNGKAVIAAGLTFDVPEGGIVAGLTAAMHDTGLRNLANPTVAESLPTDHDGLAADGRGVGILSQVPSWDSPAVELMVPADAARRFFESMRDEAGGAGTSPAQLAGRVQRSAQPDAYAADEMAARQFYRDHVDEVRATRCSILGPILNGGPSGGFR